LALLNPVPQKIPNADQETKNFLTALKDSLFTIWFAIGGKDGLPTINIKTSQNPSSGTSGYNELTGVTDTPTTDPGWASSSTVNMNAPDGYIKMFVGTQAVVIPYWNT
jgi:hypothetical protein